jgi:hypothetical protein
MTIKFRDPWVDPRVAGVTYDAFRDYLVARGWQQRDRTVPYRDAFENDEPGKGDLIQLPLREDEGTPEFVAQVCWVLEMLAKIEGRWVGPILDDVLRGAPPLPAQVNGAPNTVPADSPSPR